MEIISCSHVNFAYPGCEENVLRNVSFSIQRSEFVVLCGKSGCGKSTLLRQLKKNLMPYGNLEGHILYCGQEVEAYIKVARQQGADLRNEIQTIQALNNSLCPQILDYDERDWSFVVTLAKPGERLSAIVGENSRMESMAYLY